MIRIEDKGTSYNIEVYGVPAFPRYLEDKAEISVAMGEDEAEQFVKWWAAGCLSRGYKHPGYPLPEEWKHTRAMLARIPYERLRDYAVTFWAEQATENMRGVALMRAFRHYLPAIEAQWKQT